MTPTILRPAKFTDMGQIGHVAGLAFFDDNILGHHMHPFRQQFPGDFASYWSRRASVHYWDYGWKQVVAVRQDASGNDVIVGVAQCMRSRPLRCVWWGAS